MKEVNLDLRVFEVGKLPTKNVNMEIARLLGYGAELINEKLMIQRDGEIVSCPDYVNDACASAEEMEFQNRVPYLKPTRDKRGKPNGCVCIFDHEGEVYVTQREKTAARALAAALLFVLRSENDKTGSCQP